MEYENKHEYASRGVGAAGLTLGVIGTALGAMSGGLGNTGLFAARNGCSEDHCVNRYEFGLQQEIAAKDSKIALLESNIYVDSKIADVYERLNGKIGVLEAQLADQRVYNATMNGTVSCLQGQIMQLMSLTKLVIPNASICPGWTTTTTTTP